MSGPSSAAVLAGTPLPREMELLLACARTARACSRDRRAALKDLLLEPPDWTRFVELALRHAVTPLVYTSLAEIGAPLVPHEISDALEIWFEQNTTRTRALECELAALSDALEARGIPTLAYKGPTLGRLAYGESALRTAGDLDLLLRTADVGPACALLAERGYVRRADDGTPFAMTDAADAWIRSYQCELLYQRPEDGMLVEPHWAIVPRTYATGLDLDAMWDRAQIVPFGSARLRTFGTEDLLLVLCVHASKHAWSNLRWVADVAELVRNHPLDWFTVCTRARAQGVARMLDTGLALAAGLLEAPLPEAARSAVASDPVARTLGRRAARSLSSSQPKSRSVFRLSLFQVRLRERARDRFAYALRTAFTPRFEHLRLVPLPAVLSFLYYPLKIATDTLALPVWRRIRRRRSRGVRA